MKAPGGCSFPSSGLLSQRGWDSLRDIHSVRHEVQAAITGHFGHYAMVLTSSSPPLCV